MAMTAPVLHSPRLTLRPFRMSDAPAIASGIGNWDVLRWLSVVPHPYSVADAQAFVATRAQGNEKELHWAICDDTGLVGGIGLGGELGYWIARPAWRRGYGFEAANAVVAHWFGTGAEVLHSGCFAENARSAAVLRALFFRESGRSARRSVALSQEVEGMDFRLTAEDWAARMAFRIETERLRLRPLAGTDAAALSGLAVPEVARNLKGLPSPLSIEAARDIIQAQAWRGHGGFHLGIEENGRMIGILGCGRTPISIMYAIHPDHWGRGIATEAVAAFLPEIFARLPVSRIFAEHMVDNPASGAVLRKLGFSEVGTGTCTSQARLETVPAITYALEREDVAR